MREIMMRNVFIVAAMALVGAGAWFATRSGSAPVESQEAIVHLTPTCGCCGKWVEHLNENGFEARRQETSALGEVKTRLKVPLALQTCHTAEIGGYVVEGHVPADAIRRLLREKPEGVVGIGVAGMPIGSPGMEVAGRPADSYEIVVWDSEGRTRVWEGR